MLFLFLILSASAWSQSDCTQYNKPIGSFTFQQSNTNGHITGQHWFADVYGGSCKYSGTSGTCSTDSEAFSDSGQGAGDSGVLAGISGIIYDHIATTADKNGSHLGTGAVSSDAEGAIGYQNCLNTTCTMTINISGSGQGAGFSVSFSNANVWSDEHHVTSDCPAQSVTSTCTYTPPPFSNPGAGCQWVYNSSTCTWTDVCNPSAGTGSPIIVDTNHTGFHLTDPQTACVTFNLSGTPACYSWPEHGSGNAWLVYDADGSGVIDSGKELFGNFTPHSNADWLETKFQNNKDPNGFLALQWFDQPAQGGDGNLIIDKRDQVWTKLKLWIDDHCYLKPDTPCVSIPGELHPLAQFGITSISLVYTYANDHHDTFQNDFRYSAVLNPDAEAQPINAKGESCCDQHQHSNDGRLTYDVWLQTKQ